MNLMTVGEVANAVGVSPKAIRVWESRGLIPRAERTATGYRTFTKADLATFRFIRQAKALGLTLGEIGDIIGLQHAGVSPCGRVVEVIEDHLSTIERAIADLVQLRQTLTLAKDDADSACPKQANGNVCHIIERAGLAE